ncbi:MAG: hypothetical protein E7646_01110 [Ruminococcaceae bacterium]|nr:hypothetical protein [Oscillospiraceae bacterium]
MKKIICALFILSTLLSLVSCSAGGAVVISYKDQRLTERDFIYELAMEKSSILSENDLSQDDASLWAAKDSEGKTMDKIYMENLKKTLVLRLYFAQYAIDKGYGLTDNDLSLVKDSMNKYAQNFSSLEEFNGYMSNFDSDYDSIHELMKTQYLSQKGQYLLFGSGGEKEITEENAREFFVKNYATSEHIFINNVSKVYPNQKVVPLNDEEKAEKNAYIEDLKSKITAENFKEYLSVSEEKTSEYTICQGMTDNREYEEKLFQSSVGEISYLQTEQGFYFILRKELNADYITDDETKAIMSLLTEKAMDEIYLTVVSSAEFNDEILNKFSFSSAKYFTSY